ncbi:hypothetical protein [Nocardioides bruguierae]|uniref:TrbL/VirB6 plasmid conjugal transfer protein n=1 Tax=Nocardioides bruguierae TaxID=2945102 RepID=A0A9X2DBG0_9ACTN|nr:hypothetical protein [Nocardioides bruguierae]MCM0622534.1 hypothetical protein [Nocardioides bruguierae]
MRPLLPRLLLLSVVAGLLGLLLAAPASAIPGFPDCKTPPTPEVPGRGLAGYFSSAPSTLPEEADPFEADSGTTIYEQYGLAGFRWHTYDLGCGPDAMRAPDAVIGTAISNWITQIPLALTALTGSVIQQAFAPDFLDSFDGAISDVSSALHDNLFVSWIPFVIAAIGGLVIIRARSASLASTAGAVGWALLVILLATALFRWPVEAGQAADDTVTQTLGTVVTHLDGQHDDLEPGTAVASGVTDALLYRAWLAGALGSADSATARTYGPQLFQAQALTWREAQILEDDPDRGQEIIEQKQEDWKDVASEIEDRDPEAYEYLTGQRSEARVGYAILSATGTLLALPFLLVSALLLIGCFLLVRLAVMLFPAFATLGAFPTARGLVIGLGRLVGAAVVNAILFGIGAAVTIAVLGLLLDPSGAPAWLGLVLMPVFSLLMWVILKPFRRLTAMVSPRQNPLERLNPPDMSGVKRLAFAGLGLATSGISAGAGAFLGAKVEDELKDPTPERAEARPAGPPAPGPSVTAVQTATQRPPALEPAHAAAAGRHATRAPEPPAPAPASPGARRMEGPAPAPPRATTAGAARAALPEGFVPRPTGSDRLEPVEPHEYDGEEVYTIYRPHDADSDTDSLQDR